MAFSQKLAVASLPMLKADLKALPATSVTYICMGYTYYLRGNVLLICRFLGLHLYPTPITLEMMGHLSCSSSGGSVQDPMYLRYWNPKPQVDRQRDARGLGQVNVPRIPTHIQAYNIFSHCAPAAKL